MARNTTTTRSHGHHLQNLPTRTATATTTTTPPPSSSSSLSSSSLSSSSLSSPNATPDHTPTPSPNPPNRPNRYLILLAATSVLFTGIGTTNTFGIFQDYYTTHTLPNTSPSAIILIGSCASSLYLILGAFTGRFADLIGYRPSLTLGSLLMIAGNFAASFSSTYTQLGLSQGLCFGLGLAFAYLPAVSVSRAYFPESHGTVNGVVVSGGALGGTLLPYLCKRLITAHGLPLTFRVLGYISIALLLPACFIIRPPTTQTAVPNRRRNRTNTTTTATTRPPLIDLSLLSSPQFLSLLLPCTIAMIGFLPRYFLLPSSAISSGIPPTTPPGFWV